ncbi:YodL domain-containing protein [Flintibacter porci]|uniref:YodL domain-containing protein n=1 Tax=Flintibacter porci TaxID=3342383 RepID=UPI003F8B6168
MAENVFEAVKQSVTLREAAELYGIEVGRGGMACCPFHDDRHPSMKLNEDYFYCFGCGATGDVIDFTARLYDLPPREAAEKLALDFGLAYDSQAPPRRNHVRQTSEAQKRKEAREHGWRVLVSYYHLLRKWETDYSPKTPDEDPHPRFMEAIQKKDYMGYLLDTFLDSSTEAQDQWIAEHTAEISAIERRVNNMADKPTNRERLQQITAGIEQGIQELFESNKYRRYLSVMSRFHRYSVNNTMLIYMQRPDATLVAGYNKWKNQFSRHVKRGEHGITIIAPTPYKKKIEEQKLDPDTKAPMLDADGKVITEEKEVEIPLFRPVKVFDVRQTDGKPLPELASSLSGNVQNYEVFLEALRRSAPIPIEFEPMAENMDGYFSSEQQRIALRPGMSEVQTVSAAIHEIAHSKLHDYAKAQEEAARSGDKEPPKKKDRHTEEVEAESISYAVCQYYGIETAGNSFGYIASWSEGKELKELRASLETINKTAGELISAIDRHYKEICKERGIDLTAQPEQAALQPDAASEPEDTAKTVAPGSTMLPDTQEQALDEYPMPDPALTQDNLEKCGYLDGDLLPLSKERAYELMERDLTVYIIQEGENPEMAFDTADLDAHDGIFAVARDEWEQSSQFHDQVLERQERQPEREQAFLSHEGDCFAIYQVKHTDELRDIRYEGLDQLQFGGRTVQRENYDLVYTAPLDAAGTTDAALEHLYRQFNLQHPADYHSPSMSVSDIVALKQDGVVSCHYVDRVGFQQISGFLPDNPLKNAEMTVEDDYGMIDGILNNGQCQPPPQPERQEKRRSVVEQLKSQPKTEPKKTAPKKSAEREL